MSSTACTLFLIFLILSFLFSVQHVLCFLSVSLCSYKDHTATHRSISKETQLRSRTESLSVTKRGLGTTKEGKMHLLLILSISLTTYVCAHVPQSFLEGGPVCMSGMWSMQKSNVFPIS